MGLNVWDLVQLLALGAVLGGASEFLLGLCSRLLLADDRN